MSAADPASLDDLEMQKRFREIVAGRGIKCIVETGVHHGLSTVILAGMVETVFAIDIEAESLKIAACNLQDAGRNNAVLCLGNSPWVLRSLAPTLPAETLYFLDAHWRAYWPLLDEVRAVRRGSGVIVVHDCKVPGHPELYYDSYNGHPCSYEYLREELTGWSPGHKIEYNSRTEGIENPHHRRGCLYVFPN